MVDRSMRYRGTILGTAVNGIPISTVWLPKARLACARRPNLSRFVPFRPPRAQILAARAIHSSQVSQIPSTHRANSHDSARPARSKLGESRARASPNSPDSLRLARGILTILAPRAPQVRQKWRVLAAISDTSGKISLLRGALGERALLPAVAPSVAHWWCLLDRRSCGVCGVTMWGCRRSVPRLMMVRV